MAIRMGLAKCAICGEWIDKGACNQEFTIITIVRDSDIKGTRKERKYLCEGCTASLELWLLGEPETPEQYEKMAKHYV